MPALEIQPFSDEHLDAAGALLAERQRRHREVEPLLPADLDFRAETEALLARGGTGVVGIRDGRVVAYLVGTRLSDDLWGANAWIELAGHATESAEDARDLYGAAAAGWLREGRHAHYIYLPASDPDLIDAWFRVSFGVQHGFGIRELTDLPTVEIPGVVVREADGGDVDALVEIGPSLGEHQARSPVFALVPPDPVDELRAEIIEDLADPKRGVLVAELDGRVVGAFEVVPIEYSGAHYGLARAPGLAHLGFAAILPGARGSGVGLALTAASFAWAKGHGYPAMVTDWRVTNLLSSRFWPRRGFRTTFLRLHRYVP